MNAQHTFCVYLLNLVRNMHVSGKGLYGLKYLASHIFLWNVDLAAFGWMRFIWYFCEQSIRCGTVDVGYSQNPSTLDHFVNSPFLFRVRFHSVRLRVSKSGPKWLKKKVLFLPAPKHINNMLSKWKTRHRLYSHRSRWSLGLYPCMCSLNLSLYLEWL